MHDPFGLIHDVWTDLRDPLSRHLPPFDLKALEERVTDGTEKLTPCIVVFGTYNAGKSTLINALIGSEMARTSDHPETDRVTRYGWRGHFLDDTPGIDAPAEHEQVTREYLQRADAVLFVISTDGSLEEQRTLDELMALVQSDVPLRVVINNKSGFHPDSPELLGLRDRLTDKLRNVAAAAGIPDAGERAPIRVINAASALRGRLQHKPVLLLHSGILELESDLAELCATTGKYEFALTLCRDIARQIDVALDNLPRSDEMPRHREDVERLAAERVRVDAALASAIKQAEANFRSDLRQALAQHGEVFPASYAEAAYQLVGDAFDNVWPRLAQVLRELELEMDKVSADLMAPIEGDRAKLGGQNDASEQKEWALGDFARAVGFAAKMNEKVMVDGLLAAKQAVPGLFKGLGPKFFGRAVPLIGPAVQVAAGAYDAIQESRRESRQFELEKERRAALNDAVGAQASRLTWDLQRQCQALLDVVFGPAEAELASRTTALRKGTAETEHDRALLLRSRGRIETRHIS